jgi:TATA-binding protein-associated factor
VDLVDEDDVVKAIVTKPTVATEHDEMEARMNDPSLSKRELNALKRKMKMQGKHAKSQSKSKKIKMSVSEDIHVDPPSTDTTCESTRVEETVLEGTLPDRIVENTIHQVLLYDLFHPAWEVRHGACIALRDVFIAYGTKIGWNGQRDQILQDVLVHLFYLCSLDRFNDFISDQVVAPVRETAAQAIGVLVKLLDTDSTSAVIRIIQAMVLQAGTKPVWQVRHAGLLALKYLVAAKKGMEVPWMHTTIEAILIGLGDKDDDVVGVSASILMPAVHAFSQALFDPCCTVLQALWNIVVTLQDDLAASTTHIIDLLAKFLTLPNAQHVFNKAFGGGFSMQGALTSLYPLFRHPITSVRDTVLTLLDALAGFQPSVEWIHINVLRMLFQNVLLDEHASIVDKSVALLDKFVRSIASNDVYGLTQPVWHEWHALTFSPIGKPLDTSFLLHPKAARSNEPSANWHNLDALMIKQDLGVLSVEVVMNCRYKATRLMGTLLRYWPQHQVMDPLLALVDQTLYAKSSFGLEMLGVLLIAWSEDNEAIDDALKSTLAERLDEKLGMEHPIFVQNVSLLEQARVDWINLANVYGKLGVASNATPPVDLWLAENSFTFDYAMELQDKHMNALHMKLNAKQRKDDDVQLYREQFQSKMQLLQESMHETWRCARSMLAAATVAIGKLPKKMNVLIRSLVDGVKAEKNELYQRQVATSVSVLIHRLSRSPSEASKVDKMLLNIVAVFDNQAVALEAAHPNEQQGILSTVKADQSAEAVFERGAMYVIQQLCRLFGPELMSLKTLREVLEPCAAGDVQDVISLLLAVQVMCAFVPHIDVALHPTFQERANQLQRLCIHDLATVRHVSSHALAMCCAVLGHPCMNLLIDLLPRLKDTQITTKQGVVEAVYVTIDQLQEQILPYLSFFIVPMLGAMSDQGDDTRNMATRCFALLVQLMPLETNAIHSVPFTPQQVEQRNRERSFIAQLTGSAPLDTVDVPSTIQAELRSYQKDGVNWLGFLNKYHLHGVLSDDMGLGKTLQCICILAHDHQQRTMGELQHVPSLVICPPTLTGHWADEISTYCSILKAVQYTGNPAARQRILKKFNQVDVVIASYDIVRNDVDILKDHVWNYCILDEGHYIRNPKAKVTTSIKSIVANHRLILSGTPIQNNVTELWSLFDFLMPGFLGTEQQFDERIGKHILASRDAKAGSREHKAGQEALEKLHRQVLPFMLRRLKEDVLQDLPPKIIQDYFCDLSHFQKRLYEHFLERQAHLKELKSGEGEKATHVFQALQYLRRLCSHPRLAITSEHPLYTHLKKDVESTELHHAPKLIAIRDILHDCGIGLATHDNLLGDMSLSTHRVLIFCQLKSMLDIIEQELLRRMHSVSYLRLDGSVDASHRFNIVKTFNNDPSVDILLLTTSVGGLGLNLTGADTVIFAEHDWNPMKDLQAMDRAHRLGQKKVVNVYRLITRSTIEEKIMSLQKFKLNVANTVVSQQNSSLQTMQTDQLLDLFTLSPQQSQPVTPTTGLDGTMSALVDNLQELWDEKEYVDEFNVDQFMQSL